MQAIILAGGKSTRMKTNKSFVKLQNQPLIERIVGIIKPIFDDKILIISNEPELYKYLNVPVACDIVKGYGPIRGIYTGLKVSQADYNFFIPCDMPFIENESIQYMIDEHFGYDVIVPEINGYIEPLYGIYSKKCLQPIKYCLEQNKFNVRSFYDQVKVKTIPESVFRNIDPELKMFTNINTPKHLELAQDY